VDSGPLFQRSVIDVVDSGPLFQRSVIDVVDSGPLFQRSVIPKGCYFKSPLLHLTLTLTIVLSYMTAVKIDFQNSSCSKQCPFGIVNQYHIVMTIIIIIIIIIIQNECHSNIIVDRLQGCGHSKKLRESESESRSSKVV